MDEQNFEMWVKELELAPQAIKENGVLRLRKLAGTALMQENYDHTLSLTAIAKALRIPCEGIDQLRGLAFMGRREFVAAYEALKEELRWFPQNKSAKDTLEIILQNLPKAQINLQDAEFTAIFPKVRPYTMVGVQRLETLFKYAKEICAQNLAGNFVECGVAGGGSSGMLAWVLKHHDTAQRTLFCCDSFSGMPPSDENDTHRGIQAEQTHWGAGTCSAPESSVQSLCEKLGAQDKIVIVKGYFCDTLPLWKEKMGPIAFLHLDGDWYSSTRDILVNLYDQLVPGAFVQIDDYGHWDGCRKAVQEFEAERGVKFELTRCDGTGVWFKKMI